MSKVDIDPKTGSPIVVPSHVMNVTSVKPKPVDPVQSVQSVESKDALGKVLDKIPEVVTGVEGFLIEMREAVKTSGGDSQQQLKLVSLLESLVVKHLL